MDSPSQNDLNSLRCLIKNSLNKVIDEQRSDGSFRPTRSGVYDTKATPVRNTSRWLLINIKLINSDSGINGYPESAYEAASYLISDESRPGNHTFQARESGEDLCDGLVGQSEPIEGLTRAGIVLNNSDFINTAIEVFSLHPFNYKIGLWEAVEIDGKRLSFDRTLNHQILFAASAAELRDVSALAEQRVIRFLDQLGDNMRTRSDGLVRHYVRPPLQTVLSTVAKSPKHWSLLWNEGIARCYSFSQRRRCKELGYHSTVLAALAKLKRKFPNHDIWGENDIRTALNFTDTDSYRTQIKERTSEYGSMLPGINHARILHVFEDANPEELRQWVQLDINRTYDPETGMLTRNAVDPVFQASSISAATELPDIEIEIPKG